MGTARRSGTRAVLLELADSVREGLIGTMTAGEVAELAQHLDPSQIAELVPVLHFLWKELRISVINGALWGAVMGSSILLTAVTDSMGFLIFLGMAALLLV